MTQIQSHLIYPTLVYLKTSFTQPCAVNPHLCTLCTIYPDLSNTWFIQHLVYPTPGLSDTFYGEQIWSDKRGPTVCICCMVCLYDWLFCSVDICWRDI